ncbi:hypothetical protein A1OW_18230 [Enterovibrio norvegicus]|nr:hypothetical protein A1OW_18230 [Enterovibrio norvegicus]
MLVVFVPLMLSFVPDYAPYVDAGFAALKASLNTIGMLWRRSLLIRLVFVQWCAICWSSSHSNLRGSRVGILETLAISLSTGVASSIATIAALRTDVRWIKQVQDDQEKRIRSIEKIISSNT